MRFFRAILSILSVRSALFTLSILIVVTVAGCPRRPAPRSVAATTGPSLRLAQRAQSFAAIAGSSELAEVSALYPRSTNGDAKTMPFELTASDGTGLRLLRLRSRAVIMGPLAMTEMHLTFVNPEPRVIEGRFTITLPADASVSRFAMKLPQGWQEAEVVERQRARQVYEDFLHRGQDPALLERKAGNQFRARVFPIPAGGTKEIIVSYAEPLADPAQAYRLSLKGLPVIDAVDLAARVTWPEQGQQPLAHRQIRFQRKDWTPDRDFVVAPPPAGVVALRSGNLLVARARVAPQTSASGSAALSSLLVLVDTSASRAPAFAAQVETLGALIRGLGASHGDLKLKVLCFDQVTEVVFEGQVGRFGELHHKRILARRPLGASNLDRALEQVAAEGSGYHRVLLVTDGVPTAGATEAAELKQAVSRLRGSIDRLDVLVVGGLRDESLMRQLVVGNLEQDGKVLDDDDSTDELVRRIGLPVSSVDVTLDLDDGAEELGIWPRRLKGVQPGDHAVLFVRLPASAARSPVLPLRVGKQQHALKVHELPQGALIERAWAEAHIRELQARSAVGDTSAKERQRLQREIVDLSIKHRVLSDYTAMLVLESEADYARYGIARKALADVLVIDDNGLRQLRRAKPVTVDARARIERPVERVNRPADGERPAPDASPRQAPRAALSTDQFVPGDPEVVVDAPADATKVTLVFPTGEIKPCSRDAEGSKWRASFLIPSDTPDGIYTIRVLITRRSGEQLARNVRYQVDGTEPKVHVELSPASSRPTLPVVLQIVPQQLGAAPPANAGASSDIGDPTFGIRVLQDIAKASARLPGGNVIELVAGANGRFAATFSAPRQPGKYPITAVVTDHAGNKVTHTVMLLVDPKAATTAKPIVDDGKKERARSERPRIRQRNEDKEGPAVTGQLAQILTLLERGAGQEALLRALRWRASAPGDVLALVGLGEAVEAAGGAQLAARIYGSIIDLYPSRADMRRFAGGRLAALGHTGHRLAADTYTKAAAQRPDHQSSHQLLGMAQLRLGAHEAAIETFEAGLKRRYHRQRAGVAQVLRANLGLAAAAFVAKKPQRRAEISRRLARVGATIASKRSLRFVLTWETDANDVDLHLHDSDDNLAYYGHPKLPSGGELVADVTTGYGPESFAIEEPNAYPYRIRVHYYGRGAMGYGMGQVVAVRHDGKGGLSFEDRPFVIMNNSAFVDLGLVAR